VNQAAIRKTAAQDAGSFVKSLSRLAAACVPFIFMGMAAEPVSAANCTDIFPEASEMGEACIFAWVPDTAEQEKDFLIRCQIATAGRFLGFERNINSGRITCMFKPRVRAPKQIAQDISAETAEAPDQTAQMQDSGNPAERGLLDLVQFWSDMCLKKERERRSDTTGCWLDAAKAVDSHAAEVDAALAHQINELQAAWLHRARDLLATQAQEITFVQPIPAKEEALDSDDQAIPSSPICPSNVLNGPGCTEMAPAREPSQETDHVSEANNHAPAPRKSVKRKPLQHHVQERTAPDKKAARSTAVGQNLRKKQTQTQGSIAVEGKRKLKSLQAEKKVALADQGQVKKKTATTARSGKRLLLTKTATTSKCYVSAEWC
jgi:hypothetical protein